MENDKTAPPETVEDIIGDNKIVSVFLSHKTFKSPKKYPKLVAIQILKNQKIQKGFKNAYSISEVVRKGK